MSNDSGPIQWFDMAPQDYPGLTFEDLSGRFRSNTVTGMLTHLELLNGAVLNLLSPVGTVFGEAGHDPTVYFWKEDRLH